MVENSEQGGNLNFSVDKTNLYKEETITDARIATFKKLIPVKPDGSDDTDRKVIFLGRTQLNTPQGPIPIQAKLEADTLDAAMDLFPKAMEMETARVVESIKQMQAAQKKEKDSRIIVPGMN